MKSSKTKMPYMALAIKTNMKKGKGETETKMEEKAAMKGKKPFVLFSKKSKKKGM